MLIEGGVEINTVDEVAILIVQVRLAIMLSSFQKSRTALLHASHEGHINIVRFLLQKGANNNWQSDVSTSIIVQITI